MNSEKRRVNILLVDDSPANLLVLQALLSELDENLVLAASGEEALQKLLQQDFAAILMDVRMPVMGGFETARLIRGKKRTRQTPIIFVTAENSEHADPAAAYAMGAVDFLTKPIIPAVLRAKVAVFVELFRSREELRGERAFLHAVLETVSDSIVACGPHGQITLMNRAATQLRGQAPTSAERELFTTAPSSAGRSNPLHLAFQGHTVTDHEVVLEQGEFTRTLLASGARLHDGEGRELGAVVSLRDVTALRNVQRAQEDAAREEARREQAEALAEQLQKNQDDLRRLANDLSEADRRKTEFLATLAHELRNPLAPLLNGVKLLRLAEDKPQVREKTHAMMERQVHHMVRLVDDLLDVARINSGKVQLQKERVELGAMIKAAVENCSPGLQARNHTLDVTLPVEPLYLDADPVRITQVLCNLLTNAIKYTPAGGKVHLLTRSVAGEVFVEIEDSGVGIPPEALPHVFDMFTQVQSNLHRSDGGLGIGLALVRSLVEMHGGAVSVASAGLGCGSTFTMRLPLGQNDAVSQAAVASAQESMKFNILVVDDNVDAADSLAAVLQFSGHDAFVAHDGINALKTLSQTKPDVVFLDIGMPGMNGYEVAKRIRQTPDLNAITLVALTGWGAQTDRQRSREAGFDHHLTKPANIPAIDSLLLQVSQTRAVR